MAKIKYEEVKFAPATLAAIEQANAIIEEYQAQGFVLTVRQLYYQFVSRDLLPNTIRDYKRLAGVVSSGRLAGLIDWSTIEDRTRNLAGYNHYRSPGSFVAQMSRRYRKNRWANATHRIEVWIEKEALAGVFERACGAHDVDYFCCRGYASQSEMWAAAERLRGYERAKQSTVILHFGDHDPSGVDMTRDIQDRLSLFRSRVEVRRIALTMAQVEEHNPPPNPAKVTDARFDGYNRLHGDESWELDALDPGVLSALVDAEIARYRDQDEWDRVESEEEEGRELLASLSERWADVAEFLYGGA